VCELPDTGKVQFVPVSSVRCINYRVVSEKKVWSFLPPGGTKHFGGGKIETLLFSCTGGVSNIAVFGD